MAGRLFHTATRRNAIKANLLLAASLLAGCAGADRETCRVYFGTSAVDGERGIYMAELNLVTGALSDAVRVSEAARPGFITIHPDGRHIYATGAGSTAADPAAETVSAFRILENGWLADINTQPSGGAGPCHVSLDPAGDHLLVANYMGGSCAVLPIRTDGALAPPSTILQHSGSGAHPTRQTKAHAHSINTSPDGRFAFVADLGIDKIMVYRFDPGTGKLEPNDPPFAQTEPGGGPRHFAFHPNGRFAYTNLELSNKVTAFSYDAGKGALQAIQTLSTLPEDCTLPNTTAEITLSSDGRFLYVSNRGHNSIAVFSIDAKSGTLTFRGCEPVRGDIPRHFNIDPTGNYLVVASQKSGNVTLFRIDRTTGKLEFTGCDIKVPSPICVQFLCL